MGHDRARWGSVTLVQRFGSSLNLHPHVHVLMLDGVYVDGEETPVFVAAPPLSDQAVQQIVETSARRIIRLCRKRGLLDRHRSRSARRRGARAGGSHRGFGARAHRHRGTLGSAPATGPERSGHRGAYGALVLRSGFALRSKRRGRMGPAISCALRWNCWRSGRLWSPRPGSISYATTGSWPPVPATAAASCRPSRLPSRRRRTAIRALRPAPIGCAGRTLLARVFSSDISECAACGGRLRIIAAMTDSGSIRRYLEGVGLPPRAPPRAPPQPPFEFPDCALPRQS